MSLGHIFISHTSKDDDFVKALRLALEGQQLLVWADSRELRGGDKLTPEIERQIESARQFIVVISLAALNSAWVQKEVKKALEVEQLRQNEGYKVIPLLLPGVEPSALSPLFPEEPVGIKIELNVGSVSEALPHILAALGERLPMDHQPPQSTPQKPVEELLVKLSAPQVRTFDGKTRAQATARLVYESADKTKGEIESDSFDFTAPLGPIEADDLRWYLEEFFRWPTGLFKERADRIAAQLPNWGKLLFDEAARSDSAKEVLNAWRNAAAGAERRFSVLVDSDLPEGSDADEHTNANEAASLLLSLPWELLHDERGFLFHGKNPVRVRRRLPNRNPQPSTARELPIRILLVSPRPEEQGIGYIDHRSSAKPLVKAVEKLGEVATLTLLAPPTYAALKETLKRAADAGEPFDIVHFDGHGVYDRNAGLSGLCFEDAKDVDKLEGRASELIYAAEKKGDPKSALKNLAALLRDYCVPLVFLEACQSAQAEADPTTSVAAKLLEEGVTSVVAMSHSVLVETARRFVKAFYTELAHGARVGTAMLAGQDALINDTYRGQIMGAGALHLQDWFVPVLYQEAQDPQLVTQLPSEQVRQLLDKKRDLSLGKLTEQQTRMNHAFVGRSRDLLKLERMLLGQAWPNRYVVVRGRGGEGKTTIAVELAHWLVRTHRFDRAAFVSLEQYTDARGVLMELGQQLLPEGDNWHVGDNAEDFKQGRLKVERALRDHRTIIVLDNVESLFFSSTKSHEETRRESDEQDNASLNVEAAPRENLRAPSCDFVDEIFALCQDLLNASQATRLVFTSREPLPEPFHHRHRVAELRELARNDAIELVSEVMKREGLEPKYDDAGNTPQEIAELVAAVGCHARALTLLARELTAQGVRATTDNVHRLMAELERKHSGKRENSLYASVALSLRRLPPEMREQVKALGVFHDGAQLWVLQQVLGVDEETARQLAVALIEVGLAEEMGYGYLRLDPALPPYLLRELTEPTDLRTRWAAAMTQLTNFLYEQQFQNAELSARLTLLELPNLLALLHWAAEHAAPEEVVDLADSVERLIANLGRPQALAQATRVREQAAGKLGAWSHARYLTESAQIDRWLEQRRLPEALAAARQLLQRALAAGEEAFAEARYDIAWAHFKLGRVLSTGGKAEAALTPLQEARQQFQALADAGDTAAVGMAAAAITERANCLRGLGRLEAAAAAYQEAIARAEKRGNLRDVAVNKGQLGTIRNAQQRYAEALAAYDEARGLFERLGEPGTVATAWHQTGIVYREAGQYEQAERAYRQSLAIKVQQQNPAGEASSLNELGNLYNEMERWEEAVKCYRQAAEIHVRLQDQRDEGLDRSNLADTLIKLRRYDEARPELLRAIECDQPYGHAAQPWTTWDNLCKLERATGDAQAAAQARERARALYLQYRRDGGESMEWGAQLCAAVAAALQDGAPESVTALAAELDKWLQANAESPRAQALLPKLQAILRGAREAGLAEDAALNYDDAVELQLLLERLG